ncbi:TetR/AcrR family transcriptional regulator [Wielerella bovis]|uniref:TetR/AcrR family transcriptional regulator n=1 Tax=Wielerella bovis TaxID=2917790 RepID=UPI002018851B|nr:TetR/AcrR family transcriptional regulator [Wielerella bovis]MCG7657668.1 TetR/AcrR family transcriptional regulator [Wielerella bovis]MCG7659889.1 TetR/AcrR family transcriptional regulator [Wielerella bovis]
MSKESRPSTYNRIVDASLQLFNEQGERNISTNHIANHLGISPGNLYYHFSNKDEIIVQLFKRYSHEMMTYLHEIEHPNNIIEIVKYFAGIYDILWQYRFLFSDVNGLLTRNRELLGKHNEFTHEQFSPLAIELIGRLKEQDIIHIDEVGIRNLTINLWLVSKYWFDFDISLYGADSPAKKIKARGVYRTLSLLRPHLTEKYIAEFDEQMCLLEKAS